MSRPQARHSYNLARRATVSVVIFNSTVTPQQAQAVYLEALAEELGGAERDRAIAIFLSQIPGSRAQRMARRRRDHAGTAPPVPGGRVGVLHPRPHDHQLPVKMGGS